MRFPYTEVGPGIHRPVIPLVLWAASGPVVIDGLLDTGADRTLLTPKLALGLGIDVATLGSTITVQTASGHALVCKTVTLVLGLIRNSTRLCWLAEVAVAIDPVQKPHWGMRGCLEFFRAEFDGPNRCVTLTAGANLPATTPPA